MYDDLLLARAKAGPGPALAEPTVAGVASNPLCGDEIEVRAAVRVDVIQAVDYRSRACALTSASASLLAELVAGRSTADALALADALSAALADRRLPLPPGFGAIALARLLPVRRRCALLPWEALRRAIGLPSA